MRVKLDDRDEFSAGFKFNDWEMRGVPLRIEIGPRDVEQNAVVLARRDIPGKEGKTFGVPVDGLVEATKTCWPRSRRPAPRATEFREANTRTVRTTTSSSRCSKPRAASSASTGPAASEDEDRIKEETKATIRCFPFDAPEGEGVCFYTGQRTDRVAIFARAY